MGQPALSVEAKAFITEYIHSVEDLQVLLLVRTNPKKEWNAFEVADTLKIDPISASNRLVGLFLRGLLMHPNTSAGPLYRYQYRVKKTLEKVATEIADSYKEHEALVAHFIITSHRHQMSAFAEAFKLKY